MKVILILLFTFYFLLSGPVHAQQSEFDRQLGAFAGEEGAGYDAPQDPRLVVAGIIRVFLTIIGILFVSYTVYAGFLIMTASGEEEKVAKGKKTLVRAVIGVGIVMLAYAITIFVTESLRRATGDQGFEFDANIEEGRRPPPSRDPLAPNNTISPFSN